MSETGHERPGGSSSRYTHVRYAPLATVGLTNFLNWREKVSNINGCIAEVSTTGGGVGRELSLLAR